MKTTLKVLLLSLPAIALMAHTWDFHVGSPREEREIEMMELSREVRECEEVFNDETRSREERLEAMDKLCELGRMA